MCLLPVGNHMRDSVPQPAAFLRLQHRQWTRKRCQFAEWCWNSVPVSGVAFLNGRGSAVLQPHQKQGLVRDLWSLHELLHAHEGHHITRADSATMRGCQH